MTASQKIQIRMSETREKVNDLAGAESAEDISRREVLSAEYKPESTEGRPWGQPLKKPAGALLNLG